MKTPKRGPVAQSAHTSYNLYKFFLFLGSAQPTEKPLLLPATKTIEASLRNIDRIHA